MSKMKLDKKTIEDKKNTVDFGNMDMSFDMDMSSFSAINKPPEVKVKAVHETTELEIDNKEMAETLTAEQIAFRNQIKSETGGLQVALDTGFWFCITFCTYDHKKEFLEKSGLEAYGDKFIDGHKFSKAVGIELTTPLPKRPNVFKERKNFATLTK